MSMHSNRLQPALQNLLQRVVRFFHLRSSCTKHISADVQRTLNASCMTISGGRTKQLDIFCRVTGFTSDFLSFIVVEHIWFFHGALHLILLVHGFETDCHFHLFLFAVNNFYKSTVCMKAEALILAKFGVQAWVPTNIQRPESVPV